MEQRADRVSTQRFATWFVWLTWAGAVAFAGAFVYQYARRLPYSDDWYLVPVISGRHGLTLGWLWQQSAEHRLFVPRLILSVLGRLTNGDARVPVWLNLVLLGATAAAAIVTMRRVRTYSTIADAFFPLVFLTLTLPGLNWGFQVHFTSTGIVAVLVLLVMTRYGIEAPAPWLWVCAGLSLVLLGEGAPGLALLPAFAGWLALSGLRLREKDRTQGALVVATAAALIIGMALYFVGYHSTGYATPSLGDALVTALHAATAPGGDAMSNHWPLSGIAFALGLLATAGLLVARLWRTLREGAAARPEDRGRAIALTCFGAALAMLIGAIGFGRGSMGWTKGLEHHYSGLFLPLACWVYVVWDRFAGLWRTVACAVLVAFALASFGVNAPRVLQAGRVQKQDEGAFHRDLCNGVSPRTLAHDYSNLLYYEHTIRSERLVADGIEMSRSRDLEGFRCP